MNLLFRLVFAGILCMPIVALRAQGMPPPAHSNSPYYVPPGTQSGNGYTPARTIMLPDQWGAIAADVKEGVLGVSTNATSKKAARKLALNECKAKGGANCTPMLSYSNQCAVLVVGSDLAIAEAGENIDAASDLALGYCNKNDINCVVYYSACSLPQRPQ